MALRVLVAGAGAVGSVLGGLLAGAGHRVTLLGRDTHLAAIANGGLAIEGLWGDHRVADLQLASQPAELRPAFDAVLLTVKSYDTSSMLAATAALAAPDGCVIALQRSSARRCRGPALLG
jgi:2-dehydropantoate 2-reductase